MATHRRSLFEMVDDGVTAYRDGNFMQAVQILQQVLDEEPRNWRAKLYLAMSHYHAGETFTAYGHFRFLLDNCTDHEIRNKAESAAIAINSALKNKMPQMTCTMKKPSLARPKEQQARDDEDVELEHVNQTNPYYKSF